MWIIDFSFNINFKEIIKITKKFNKKRKTRIKLLYIILFIYKFNNK
jgi:hypothetical protein